MDWLQLGRGLLQLGIGVAVFYYRPRFVRITAEVTRMREREFGRDTGDQRFARAMTNIVILLIGLVGVGGGLREVWRALR
jgi:hypothetical protein